MPDHIWVEYLPKTHQQVVDEALNGYITKLDADVQLRRTQMEKDDAAWRQYIAMQLRDDLSRNRAR
jgi:hypothetical protein